MASKEFIFVSAFGYPKTDMKTTFCQTKRKLRNSTNKEIMKYNEIDNLNKMK